MMASGRILRMGLNPFLKFYQMPSSTARNTPISFEATVKCHCKWERKGGLQCNYTS